MPPSTLRLSEHFALEGEAGRGGFGVVYRARHRATGELAAAKVSHSAASPEELRRVAREVGLVAGLRHPHLARLYGLFLSDEGHPALVYEWIAGGSLEAHAGSPFPEVLRWITEAGAALDALHRQGLVHRDVKPENLMLDAAGRVRVVDFGLLRPEADGRTVTATGIILGTPAFMPPEAFRGERVGPAADRFALAGTAYWLLTGRAPFGNESPGEIVRAQRQPPPPPVEAGPEAGPALARVFAAGLAADPGDRPASCGAFAQQLRAAWRAPGGPRVAGASSAPTLRVEARPLGSPSTPRPPEGARSAARHDLRRPLAVLALGAAIGVGVMSPGARPPATPASPPAAPSPATVPASDVQEAALGPAALRAIRARLNDLQATFVDPAGKVLTEAERSQVPGAIPLLDGDPLYWAVVLRELPPLRSALGALAAGVSLDSLPEEVQEEARRTDEAFAAQGLPRPFAPHRGLRPAPTPVPHTPVDGAVGNSPHPMWMRVPLAGWAGTVRRELARATASLAARGAPLLGAGPPVPELARSITWLRIQSPKDVATAIQKGFTSPELRRELTSYFSAEILMLERALIAAGRSLRQEPETRALVATLVVLGYRGTLYAASRSYLATVDPGVHVGPLPEEEPDAAFFLYHLPFARRAGLDTFPQGLVERAGATPRLEELARVAIGPARDEPGEARRLLALQELVMGLANTGRPEEALDLYAVTRRELAAARTPLSPYLAHQGARALEIAGRGLPPALARELREVVLGDPDLGRALRGSGYELTLHGVRWIRDEYQAESREALRARLDAAVAACEAEAAAAGADR